MAYTYHVGGWIGNLGNHLLQISHALFLAERYKGICTFAEEPFIENTVFDFSSGAPTQEILWENFWEPNVRFSLDQRDYADDLHRERPRILKTFILPLLKPYKKIELGYDLVINIRGGDAFDDYSYPPYVQAPYSYFNAIMEKEQPSNVLVVAQDERNPAVGLLAKSSIVTISSKENPETDANMVLNAETLVIGGVSTWHHTLAQMSPNLKKVYYPEFGDGWVLAPDELWRKDHWYREGNLLGDVTAEVVKVYFKDYVKIGQWDRYPTQKKCDFVTNHPKDKISFYGNFANK